MTRGKRDPLQVDPLFRIKIIQLQKKIEMQENKRVSIRELSERIAKTDFLEDLEKKLLQKISNGDIKINFDRRKR